MPSMPGDADDDLVIRSVPDDVRFKVSRKRLAAASDVFEGMFACCDQASIADDDDNTVDLHEPAATLSLLVRVINATPGPYVADPPPEPENSTHIQSVFPDTAIPVPVLSNLLSLADKYMLCDAVVDSLHSHLAAYASTYPLGVYACAVERGLDDLAAQASMYLLYPPLSTYTLEEIAAIPNAPAYHKLVLLHSHRIDRLREILAGEAIFPHGYGTCPKHPETTPQIWDKRKKQVASGVLAATDVVAEMAYVLNQLKFCETCTRACTAALAMLEYKCAKIPRRVDELQF